jgi:Mn2+/Fe2+ NRAMP family transporter
MTRVHDRPKELEDPYSLSSLTTQEPPKETLAALRLIGPGLILAGAIVGSGEMIATTVLGSENGYSLLWLIVLSCLVKVVVQYELGRYAIATGETTLEALNRIPGPRLGVAWPVWLWLLMLTAIMFPVGGMLGAMGEILHRIYPPLSIFSWVWLIDGVTLALLLAGRYGLIEKTSFVLVSVFTVVTVGAAFILLSHPQYFSWADFGRGFLFQLPQGGLATAAAVFGATGVSAGELIMYPYWCIEKGYARHAGPNDGTSAWLRRVKGWSRVMGYDVGGSFVLYTFSTLAFYLLGAGVLATLALVPEGAQMVATLSKIFTETLGAWSLPLFLAGAVAVFYSSIFSATAAHGRLLADFAVQLGYCGRHDYRRRLFLIRAAIVATLMTPTLCFFLVEEPVLMVKIGGVAQALMLPVIGFSTIYLGRQRLSDTLAPKGWIRLALWFSAVVMLAAAGYYLIATYL